MRKALFVVGIMVFGLFSAPVVMAGSAAGTGINGSAHDLAMNFAPVPSDDGLQRMCIYCHTPHHSYKLSAANGGPGGRGTGDTAPDVYDYLPLWNHALTTQVFDPYQNGPGAPQSGSKASQAIQLGMTIGSSSLLCLSCHDGSVAVNTYGTTTALSKSTGSSYVAGSNLIGKDAYLGNHHPIGFDYNSAQSQNAELRDANVARLGAAGLVSDHLYGAGNMECATCHSVHNKGNTGETLLWRSDTRSRLCLTCHNKGDDPAATVP